MKSLAWLSLTLVALFAPLALAGQSDTAAHPVSPHSLTTFNLDFPGGTAGELVSAIAKAMHRPLNVLIPSEAADWKLPPMKMDNIDVAQLFQAIEASPAVQQYSPLAGFSQVHCGFKTYEKSPTDDTVWYFYAVRPPETIRSVRFYNLGPYLDTGLTVDDITTAIQTAWKLRTGIVAPSISYHSETKLLIAYGDQMGLEMIDQALKALDQAKKKPAAEKPTKP